MQQFEVLKAMSTSIFRPGYRQSWAFVVGINEYERVSPLWYAREDAIAVEQILRAKFGFPEQNTKVLLNGEATRSAILSTFLEFTHDKISEDDRVLFFFAGHGCRKSTSR